MTMPDFAYVYYKDSQKYSSSPIYRDGTLEPTADVTLQVKHDLQKFGIDDNNLYVITSMSPVKNDQYVESYDLYLVPGKYTHGDVLAEEFYHEHGHIHAQPIAHIGASELASPLSRSGDTHTFEVLLPQSKIENKDQNKEYSFFIRANYKPESNLKPSFHGLTTVTSDDQITSVSAPDADLAGRIATEAGCIILNNVKADIFTTTGVLVASGENETIAVAPGIYIVRSDASAMKVLVK